MRSDRNPYFLLRKSRDPAVQQYLEQAATMTVEQIGSLQIKPDLRKAMLFVNEFGHVTKSDTVANIVADRATVTKQQLPQYEICHYQGPLTELKVRKTALLLDDFLFLKDCNRIFASHNWFDLNEHNNRSVLAHSKTVGIGDQHMYNRMIQDHLKQKYG